MNDERKIEVCPNCGRRPRAVDYTSFKGWAWTFGMQGIVMNRFLCPRCGYSGMPIEVNEKDLKKIPFSNKNAWRPIIASRIASRQKTEWVRYLFLAMIGLLLLEIVIVAFPLVIGLVLLFGLWKVLEYLGLVGAAQAPSQKKK